MKIKSFLLCSTAISLFFLSGCKPSAESLIAAVKADNSADAVKLIAKGADANSRTSPTGWSALHFAARNGDVEVVQSLLSAGADPNYSASMNNSAATRKPLDLATASLDLVSQIPAAQMDATLRQIGLDDPALLESLKDPTAAVRYTKVVQLLAKVTK